MVRKPCRSDLGSVLNKGPWTPQEDLLLQNYVQIHGEGHWSIIPQKAGLLRCGRSCRLRWMNYLRSDVEHSNISADEEELIIRLHKLLGNRWSLIAGRIPGRTDNQIKNLWYSRLSKKPAKTATQNCNVQKPVPYKYKLPFPTENIVTANTQINREHNMDYNRSSLLLQPTNTSGNREDEMKQPDKCPDIEELIADLQDWPRPHENDLTRIEMHNLFDNSDNIDKVMDRKFIFPIHLRSFLASSSQMASDIQDANIANNYDENQQPSNSDIYP